MSCPRPACPVCAEDLIAQNLDVLRNVATSLRRHVAGVPFFLDAEDLAQEGYPGLARAARKWRPELGPFRPFAIRLVRYAMLDAIDRAERGPGVVPLDPHAGPHGNGQATPADAGGWPGEAPWVPSRDDGPARARLEAAEEASVLLSRLPRRLRRVVALRWGLGSGRPRSNREVGRLLGVSRQRVHQLYARGFALLQALAGGRGGAA